jgi:hypothetical protein
MQRKLLITVTILFCFTVCYASTLDLSGKWTGNLVKADSTNYPLNYNFTVSDSSITGTAQSVLGTFPIDSGKLDTSNTFHFQVTVNGVSILHSGKFYVDSIGLDFNLNGATAHCTLLRSNN